MQNQNRNQKKTNPGIKMSIRKKILLIFSGFSLVSLLLVSGVIGIFFGIGNSTTNNESQNALTAQIQTDLIISASENANTINEKLTTAINNVKAMADFAENLFNNPTIYGDYPSYNDTDTTPSELDLQFGVSGYGEKYISFKYSMYHLAPDVYTSAYLDADPEVLDLINVSANLDHIFRYTKTANPDFGWIYMGFEEGLFRCYPWSTYSPAYDPRARPWYDFSGLAPGEVKITNPYVDANGLGLMITIAQQVFTTTGDLIGVIAADLTIDTIQASILDISILDTGYAFMMTRDELVIAHPDLETPGLGEDLNTQISSLESIPSAILTQIVSNSSGYAQFEKDVGSSTEPYYLAYSAIGTSDFIVVTLVPESEALQSVAQLEDEIQSANSRNTITLLVVILIASAISLGLGTIIAGQITKPVQALTDAVQRLTKQDAIATIVNSDQDVLIDPALEKQDDEIGDLTRAFKSMLTSIKKDRANT